MKHTTHTVSLRAPSAFNAVVVDHEAGIIRNAAVMTAGPTKGHGFIIDNASLQSFINVLSAKGGKCKVRFRHPSDPTAEDLGTDVATLTNARIDGHQVRADVHLASHADAMPMIGNVRKYLLSKAANDPASFGLSAVIAFDPEEVTTPEGKAVAARIRDVVAVDFVGDPAANPNGLLSAAKENSTMKYDPKFGAKLRAQFGLSDKADDAMLEAVFNALTDEAKAKFNEEEKPPVAQTAPTPPATMSAKGNGDNTASLEAKRVEGITQIAALYVKHGVPADVTNRVIASGASIDDAAAIFRAELSKVSGPTNLKTPESVIVGPDRNVASLSAAVTDHLAVRAGVKIEKPHDRVREFSGMSLSEMTRAYLAKSGVNTDGMSRTTIAQLAFNTPRLAQLSHSPADLPNILANVMGKSLRQAYDLTPVTWTKWVRRATAPDFKQIQRTALSEAPSLDFVPSGGEYRDGAFKDSKEVYKLQKFGRIVSINWETIINDDLDALNRVPTAMGQQARQLEDKVVYYVLLKNAAMGDGGNLFNATAVTTTGGHANLASGGGNVGVPTVAFLDKARAAMRVQQGLNETILNLTPKFIIVPAALESTTEQLLNSTHDISKSNSITFNPYRSGATVPLAHIVTPYLDAGVTLVDNKGNSDTVSGSATGWYLAADSAQIDTMELCFLEDEPAPVVTEEDGFRVDGRQYKIRHTVAAKAIDWRGMYRNPGA